MISPETYVRWWRDADPECPICRGRGYAYYRFHVPYPLSNTRTVSGACLCTEAAK